jgi:hypothetical protein
MKTTIVPAQVTTVEDKIAGNLGFTQLLLLVTPVFLSGALFAIFPPFLKIAGYKLVIAAVLALICMSLAIRIRGKIVLTWVTVISRYNFRPRYYLFNKNDPYLRHKPAEVPVIDEVQPSKAISGDESLPELMPIAELVRLETAVSDPRAKFHFKATKKGGLGVYIHEIKEEAV